MSYAVGYAFSKVMKARHVAVGCDLRPASGSLHTPLCAGVAASGAQVSNLGECTTEMLIFAVAHEGADGRIPDCGIMITAGNGPMTQTGFRFIGPDGSPVGPDILQALSDLILGGAAPETITEGDIIHRRVIGDYTSYLARVIEAYGDWPVDVGQEPFRLVLDPGPSLSGQAFSQVFTKLGLKDRIHTFWMSDFDKEAPREADPLNRERTDRMQKFIHFLKADLGLAWGAGGDCVVAYDHTGMPINGAYLGAYLAAAVGQRFPGQPVAVDHRVVFPMLNVVMNMNTPLCIVLPGHALMKNALRQTVSCFGAELSGHYYFREFWWSDSGILAAFLTLHMAFLTPTPIAEIMKGLKHAFPMSPEIKVRVTNPSDVIGIIEQGVRTRARTDLVGGELVMRSTDLKGDWRAVLRPIRTEPGLVLTVEGRGIPDLVKDVATSLQQMITDYGVFS